MTREHWEGLEELFPGNVVESPLPTYAEDAESLLAELRAADLGRHGARAKRNVANVKAAWDREAKRKASNHGGRGGHTEGDEKTGQ